MRTVLFLFVLLALGITTFAQEAGKPWKDWSKKDAEKVLNDSSWGQSFVQTAPEPVDTTVVTNTRGGFSGDRKGESGENKGPKPLHLRARLLTAKPIREAFARLVLLQQPQAGGDLATQLQGFVDRDFGDFLVVAFVAESEDERQAKMMQALLTRLSADKAKALVSLERKDGKTANLVDYKPPVADGLGGKFVFSRTLDGQPFLSGDDEFLKFTVQFSEKQKYSFRFKVSGMNYAGKLEY